MKKREDEEDRGKDKKERKMEWKKRTAKEKSGKEKTEKRDSSIIHEDTITKACSAHIPPGFPGYL